MTTLFSSIQQGYKTVEAAADAVVPQQDKIVLPEVVVSRVPGKGWRYHLTRGDELPFVSADTSYREIILHTGGKAIPEQAARFLIRTAFECRFCYEGIVSLHAACVELGDFAVAFTGHSGMGKSTRALAWEQALGARFISGDRPAVRLLKNGANACGVPWDGKEQIFRDVEVPLKCILEVRRSSENYLRKLTPDQARQLLMQQTFVPMWDTDSAFLAMANVTALIKRVPVYRVFCGPDGDSARVIHDILVNHPELIREEAKDMKIKEGFVLRSVMDEYIVMPTGDNIAKFEGAVVLNDVSAFIYKLMSKPISREDILTAVLAEYDIDEATAARDLDALLVKFADMDLLEQ